MLRVFYEHPKMDFDSVLTTLKFKEIPKDEIINKIPFLEKKYLEVRTSRDDKAGARWVMGNLSIIALGNVALSELRQNINL
jgi:glutamyl-tRNA(Gln) amidotransferase subunit E